MKRITQRLAALLLTICLVVGMTPCFAVRDAFSLDIDKTVQGVITAKGWNETLIQDPPNPKAKERDPSATDSWAIPGISDVRATWHNDFQQKYYGDASSMSFSYLWNIHTYALATGDGSGIVEVAATQIGNIGGYPYKRWYGFDGAWCAMFVCWCADQCGIDTSIIPKTAGAGTMRNFFRSVGREINPAGYAPQPGDLIYFIWNDRRGLDHVASHVGIVERADGSRVYTIEGNSGGGGGSVRRKSYSLTDSQIVAYSKPAYPEALPEEAAS